MIITRDQYPDIIEALNCIDDDSRGYPTPVSVRDIPKRWEQHLAVVNEVVKHLSKVERSSVAEALPAHVKPDQFLDSEFYAFCNGEYDEMRQLENRDINHATASLFLNDYFEDWQLTGDHPKQSPENLVRQRRLEWLESVRTESGVGLQDEQLEEYERLKLELV